MKTIKRYTFKRMFFKQEELTYAEDAKVKKCISQLAELSSGNVSLIEALGKIYDAGVAEELFGIILKPNHPTFLHKVWNVLLSNYYDVKISETPDEEKEKARYHPFKKFGDHGSTCGFFRSQHELDERLGEFRSSLNFPFVNDTEEDEPFNSHEILYHLCQGDITRVKAVSESPAENVYRWMLIKLRCLQRASMPPDELNQGGFD